MKEHRFIELLNLYIDRQITAAETAELEAELQRNPQRQAVYRQYCQIHAATKLVYESFRAVAADQPATPAGRTGVVELFETRRRRTHWAYYAGGVAAAACLALVFAVNRPGSDAPAGTTVAASPGPAPAALVAAAPVAPAATPAAEPAPAFVGLREATVAATPDYTAMLAALREQDEERAFHNERLQIGRVQPLFDDNLFEPARMLSAQEQRVFRSQPATATPASAQQTEFSAFQFQR